MHRHFLSLILAASLSFMASAAQAEMKTTVGGTANWQAGYSDQDSAFDAGTRHQGFRNDTEVNVNVENTMDAGAKYGATIELEADVTADARGEGVNADKTFLWFEGDFGRLELGNNADVAQTMVVNAASIARATGGIDGDDEFFINSLGSAGTASFIIHPDLPSAFIGGIAEDATKIVYYTPVWSGFQLGVNYTPDQGDGGQLALRDEFDANYENVFDLGLSYNNEFDGIQISAAIVGEIGKGETLITGPAFVVATSDLEDLRAWQAGLLLGYKGFSIAGSYADWGDSVSFVDPSLDPVDSDFWTLGVAYAQDEVWGISATYLDSDNAGDEYQSLVVGADYTLAPGLTPYVEMTFFDADEEFNPDNNNGTVLLVGSYLNF